jgi:hypothetical protein
MAGFFSDFEDQLSSAQAVTTDTITTDVRDLGPVADNALRTFPGPRPMYAEIYVTEAATAAGAATVTFTVESDSTTNLATSATVHASSAAIPKASLSLGSYHYVELPKDATYERYLGVRYTIGTGPLTAGKFTVRITPNRVIGNALTYANRTTIK